MDEKIYTLTLSDGTKLENLRLNGNNFVSQTPISKAFFDNKLSRIKITVEGGSETVYENLALVQATQMGDEYWFVLREMSQQEIERARLKSQISNLSDTLDTLLISMLEGDD